MKKILFETHDNGARPFSVSIHDKYVSVDRHYPYTHFDIFSIVCSRVFYGKGSILLEIDNGSSYVHIGSDIFSFVPHAPICKYNSVVNGSDVCYPHAIDELGYVYLLIEDVMFPLSQAKNYDNPYKYYYSAHYILPRWYGSDPPTPPKFHDISKFYMGDERYMLSYKPYTSPEEWQRMSEDGPIKIVYKSKEEKILSYNDWCYMLDEYGDMLGFYHLDSKKIIEPRLS